MSGDAQPRKRKNKGKKKDIVVQRPDEILKERSGFRKSGLLADDSREEEIFATLKNSTDEVIHVQKDIGCGGNVVTKLVFFCLLATIGVMVGIILLEFRGSTDDETSSAVDSPWSITLGSFVDTEVDPHAHEGEHLKDEHEEHEGHEPDEHAEDQHVQATGGGLLSWIGFGGGEEVDDSQNESTDSEGEGFSFLSFLPFAGHKEDSSLGEKEQQDEGSWFGFGWNEKEAAVDEVEQEPEEEAYNEENNVDEEEEELEEHASLEDETEEEEEEELDEDVEEKSEEDVEEKSEEEEDVEEKSEEEEDVEEKSEEQEFEEEKEEEEEVEEFEEESQEEEEEETEKEEEREEVENLESEEFNRSEEILKEDSEEDDEEGELDYLPELGKEEEEEENDNLSNEEQVTKDEVSEEDDNTQSEEVEDVNENLAEREDDEEEKDENDSGLDNHDEDEESEKEQKEAQKDKSEEELFPEALEALRKEAEELAAREVSNDEEIVESAPEQEPDIDSDNDSFSEEGETEGMALKFGVGVALVVVAHVVLVKKWNSWAGEDTVDPLAEIPATTELKEEVHEEAFIATPLTKIESPFPPPPPPPITDLPPASPPFVPSMTHVERDEVAEESPVEDEEEREEEELEAEGEDEEEESDDLEIDKDKFRELIAKYGQDTSESSDIEQSDDDLQKVEYSGGEESPGEEGEDESPAEVVTEDEQVPSEDELKEWTGVKKTDINKITKLDSESEGEVEEEEEEEEEESEDDQPPPPPPQPSPRQRGGPKDIEEDYHNAAITNDEDWLIREELDRADEEFNYEKARTLFRALLAKNPNSPRARYGFARTFDKQAELERSNEVLNIAITGYQDALLASNVPDILFINIASRLINRLRFRGQHLKAVDVHNQLIQRFNNTPEYRTDLAITYLMINRLENARTVLKEVLSLWSEDPSALAHFGLVLKLQGNIHGCIKYFERGLASDFTTTKDARLYFHFGDALSRIGREGDAIKVYDKAVAYGLFRSRYQRSLYNVDRLTARPWWTLEETTYASFFKLLEENWIRIRDEGVKALNINGSFRDEAEGLRDKGDWKQLELFARGSKIKKNCDLAPFTCSLINSFEPAASCKRGQTKFSIMEGGTHVWPHCGPTNCRLRAHLGLIVPDGPEIRVASVKKRWKEGKLFVFDDSFEHEVWHNGTSLRLVLIVDVWHPELTRKEKLTLSAI